MKLLKSSKLLSLLLVLVISLGMIPMAAFAAGGNTKVLTVGVGERYKTIQQAINAVAEENDSTGWTITVKNGNYDRFTVNKPVSNLTIEGESRENVVVNVLNSDERFAPYDNGGINIWASDITLKNMTVVAGESKMAWGDAAISTNHSYSGGSGNSLTVDSCTVKGPGINKGAMYGVFWNCNRVEVMNSDISGFSNAIEFMLDNYSIPTGQIYHMTGNNISDCSFAIHGYMGGNSGAGILDINNNVITGSDGLRAKVIVQDNGSNSLAVNIHNNSLKNVVVGTVNLQDEGDKNDVLAENTMGTGCFYVDAIEPGTIEFYTNYQAPKDAYGHWELRNPEGLDHLDVIKESIVEANKAGSHTLSITGIPDGDLIKTFTWFKDCIYWVTDPAPSDPVVPEPPARPDWEISKSKTATNLDDNFISNITLSLPSAEQNLKTDIVFVFDESSCSVPVKSEVSKMLEQLYTQAEETGATIQIGAVQFRGEVTEFPLTTLNDTTKEKIATFMSERPKTGGSNMSMGILSGEKMLDEDTTVDESRKYLILVSDGITYIWDDENTPEQENLGVNFSGGDTPDKPFRASPDGWDVKYGQKYVPEDWNNHLLEVGISITDTINQKASYYDRDKDITADPFVKPDEQWRYMSTVDIALFMSNQAYQRVASKYHTFAVKAGVESEMAIFPYGPSFMDYLANGKTVTFDGILNDILYLVDKDSTVDDYMGYVKDDYNFDFVNEAEKISLSIGNENYEAEKISENEYAFKCLEDGSYAYTLTYIPGNKLEEEHFVWEINEPVSNFAAVQLYYSVKLMNPKNKEGVYGEYDKDGSQNKEALYTNNKATLYPVDSNNVKGEPEDFLTPTVSYKVTTPTLNDPDESDKPTNPATPSDPMKPVQSDENPQTGDNDHMILWLTLSILSLCGIITVLIIELKKKNSTK